MKKLIKEIFSLESINRGLVAVGCFFDSQLAKDCYKNSKIIEQRQNEKKIA
ncbi:hypothetical protein [Clostridium felsineum]|uniref:hypothetical protein n=1 Tax=Clostridium felsineum TaxID=36839 RepID=UPI0009CEE932|nr:hypothetical protein [Clostridium felsineum]URZ15371.1 hypothetical protein CLFE_013890 [Clostridium felsineum DSM 794]